MIRMFRFLVRFSLCVGSMCRYANRRAGVWGWLGQDNPQYLVHTACGGSHLCKHGSECIRVSMAGFLVWLLKTAV